MATIPQFGSIGDKADGILDAKSFATGKKKVKVSTKAANGVKFTADAAQNDKGDVSGGLEAALSCSECKLDFTEKWTTANAINLKAVFKDAGVDGLKVTLKGDFDEAAKSDVVAGSVTAAFASDVAAASLEIKAGSGQAKYVSDVVASLSLGQSGFVGGVKTTYAVASGAALPPIDVALGYVDADFEATFNIDNNCSDFGVNYYQVVNSALKVAGDISLASGKSSPVVTIASVYTPGDAAQSEIRARVNSCGVVGLVYGQKLSDNLSLSASVELKKDLKNATGGLSLTFSA